MARQERQSSSATLPGPLRNAASVLQKVPGAELVSRAAEGALDKVGAVSPRGRRIAVYAGAGVLGVAGVVEWPVAVTGAAVAWLTQPRPEERKRSAMEIAAGGEGETSVPEEAVGAPAGAVPPTTGAVPPAFDEEAAPPGPMAPHPGAEAAPTAPTVPATGEGTRSAGPVAPEPGAEAAPSEPRVSVTGEEAAPAGPVAPEAGAEAAPTGLRGPMAPEPGAEAASTGLPGPTAPEPGAPGPTESVTDEGGPTAPTDRTAG